MPRLYDCFTFFNEADLLEIRLNELAPVVDRFIVVEASVDFRGRPRALFYPEVRDRFAAFADKIDYIVVRDLPVAPPGESGLSRSRRQARAFARQYAQRNALLRGLGSAGPDDLVLVSDVDEVPRATALAEAAAIIGREPEVVCFELRMFSYRLNLEHAARWLRSGPRLVRRRYLRTPQALRHIKAGGGRLKHLARTLDAWVSMRKPITVRVLRDAGWHFTSMGDAAAVLKKVHSIAQVRDELDLAAVTAQVAAGRTFFDGREVSLHRVPIDAGFPAFLAANQERFMPLIADFR